MMVPGGPPELPIRFFPFNISFLVASPTFLATQILFVGDV